MKAIVYAVGTPDTGNKYLASYCTYIDGTNITPEYGYNINVSAVTSAAQMRAAFATAIVAGAPSSMTAADIIWLTDLAPDGMVGAPQAAISDAPADAVTNYNTVTTLLGALTGAVNTANSKQNDIATKLNSLLAELRTLGLISA